MASGGTSIERLVADLAPAADSPLADELSSWLAASRRFRAFCEAHRDKVRKKLRTASDPGPRRDARVELLVARLLLADRRVELAFEAYGSTRGGPDFTVSVRGERAFNLEVTRLRGQPSAAAVGRVMLAKLRQLPPSVANALLIAIEGSPADADIATAARDLRRRADAADADLLARAGVAGTRAFYDRFLRLGAVVVWAEGAAGAVAWANPSARIAVSPRALRACVACLEADPTVGSDR